MIYLFYFLFNLSSFAYISTVITPKLLFMWRVQAYSKSLTVHGSHFFEGVTYQKTPDDQKAYIRIYPRKKSASYSVCAAVSGTCGSTRKSHKQREDSYD